MSPEVAISILLLSSEQRKTFRSIYRWKLEGEVSVTGWRQTRISVKRQKYVEEKRRQWVWMCWVYGLCVTESGYGQYGSPSRQSSKHWNPRVLWFDLIAVEQNAITSYQTMSCVDLSLSQRFGDCFCLSHQGVLTVKTKLGVYSAFHRSDRSNDLITIRNREILKCL